jgi:hypothetical protein
VPGRGLSSSQVPDSQWRRDRNRHLIKNMTQGGSDVKMVSVSLDEPSAQTRVFGLINQATSKAMPHTTTSTDPPQRQSSRALRKRLLDVADRKRRWEQILQSCAKSIKRNRGAEGPFRERQTKAKGELMAVLRLEKDILTKLRAKKSRKSAFKF